MITYSANKCPSYHVFCLFECLFSAFFNACLISSDVIMIKNEFPPSRSLCTALEGLEASFSLLGPSGHL